MWLSGAEEEVQTYSLTHMRKWFSTGAKTTHKEKDSIQIMSGKLEYTQRMKSLHD